MCMICIFDFFHFFICSHKLFLHVQTSTFPAAAYSGADIFNSFYLFLKSFQSLFKFSFSLVYAQNDKLVAVNTKAMALKYFKQTFTDLF